MERRRAAYVAAATRLYHEEGTIEIDPDARVSDSGQATAGGCYVQAWVWVADHEAGESEGKAKG